MCLVYLVLPENVNLGALVHNTISKKPHEIVAHPVSTLNVNTHL
jgi:hypothetical protein